MLTMDWVQLHESLSILSLGVPYEFAHYRT